MPELTLPGPAGAIEARLVEPETPDAPIALVLHPHPLHGGTMHNKVAYALFRTFADAGFAALRINFRGVGASAGQHDAGIGELDDAAAALDWLAARRPRAARRWVAGFSFGAWVTLRLVAARRDIDRFIAVAPAVGRLEAGFVAAFGGQGLILQGDQDQIVAPVAVADMAQRLEARLPGRIAYREIAGADHFFSSHLAELRQAVEAYIAAAGR